MVMLGKLRFHYGKNNFESDFERFWVIWCTSAMRGAENGREIRRRGGG